MTMWQKCPICDGSGLIYDYASTVPGKQCPTCEGKRIISTVSGLPPAGGVQHLTPKTTNDWVEEWYNKNVRNGDRLLDL